MSGREEFEWQNWAWQKKEGLDPYCCIEKFKKLTNLKKNAPSWLNLELNSTEKLKLELDKAGNIILQYQAAITLIQSMIESIKMSRISGELSVRDVKGNSWPEGEEGFTRNLTEWEERLNKLKELI